MWSRMIVIMVLCVLALAPVGNATLVAQWEFNDVHDTAPADVTDNALTNDSRLVGGQAVVEGGGYKKATKSAEITFTGNDSFTVWSRIMVNDWDAYKRIIANDADGNGGWFLRTTNDAPARQLQFGCGAGGGNFFSGLIPNPFSWYDVAAVYDGVNDSVMIYMRKDGFASQTATSAAGAVVLSGTAGAVEMTLANNTGGANFITEETRLYDGKLTVAQLEAIPEPATMVLLLLGGVAVRIRKGL